MRNFAKRALLAVGALILTLSVGARAQAEDMVDIKLGMLPIATQAPVFIALKHGYFKEEGLKVTTQMFRGGPAVAAAVISGDVDFGYAATTSPILAYSEGAPVRIVAPSDIAGSKRENFMNVLLTNSGSGISGFKDLEGKRVAVNQLKALLELLTKASVDGAGADSSKVTFVEVPFPQMGSLLKSGQVDAVVNVEPFITFMVQGGANVVANAAKVVVGGPQGIWFSSVKTANSDSLGRFRRAIEKANTYASAHPDEVRDTLSTFTRIKPDVAAKIGLPVWSAKMDLKAVQYQADLMAKYGLLRKQLDITGLVVQ